MINLWKNGKENSQRFLEELSQNAKNNANHLKIAGLAHYEFIDNQVNDILNIAGIYFLKISLKLYIYIYIYI